MYSASAADGLVGNLATTCNASSRKAGRIALVHALAHIELNAIDLAWDLVVRYSTEDLPREFFDDWVGVAAEEAHHFELLAGRLADFGVVYGDLPAHDGLWEAAAATADDLLARPAVFPPAENRWRKHRA